MKKAHRIVLVAAAALLVTSLAAAHHGSAISYDTTHLWSTWATVTAFSYQNPHPTMTFDRTTKDGMVEHWVSELLTNPSVLARAGWTRGKSVDALKSGTRVKLYVGTSRAGGHSGIVMKIENEQGENKFPHILNGSGTALARLFVALIETHQQEDGSVAIPKALQTYLKTDRIHV